MRQRIALILAAALALGGAALIPGAHLFLTGQEDAVIVEEEILYGDPAAARGLQVTLGVDCGNGGAELLWNTVFTPGETAAASTDFTALPWGEELDFPETEELHVRFADGVLSDVTYSYDGEADFWSSQKDCLSLPARDVADRTGPGEERRETVDLSDYYQVYPLYLMAYFQNFSNNSYQGEDLLTDFFRIPVPEGIPVEVTVSRDESGQLEQVTAVCETGLPRIAVPLFTDTYAYLYFPPALGADTSRIAGGYGVYRMDYHFSYDREPRMIVDGIETVLPVEGAVKGAIVRDGELLVFSEENGMLWMSVLEAESGEVTQRLEILPVAGETPFHEAINLDRGVLIWLVGGQTAVAEKTVGGIWRVALTGDLSDAALAPRFSDGAHDDDRWDGSAAAFDGERLAVLYTLPSRETTSLPDVGLTVLDQTGAPVFAARYRRSGHFDQSSRGLLNYSPGPYHWTEDPSAILAFS